jgi:glycosyltransferase involved in cell wall biosynthesis
VEEKRKAFRAEYHLEDDVVAIGIVGRLVPIKNHALFLRAIAHLKANTSVKFRAFIVGDGESRAETEALAHELGLSMACGKEKLSTADLCFTSWLKDIDVVNAGMDIIALTSLNEGTPVSLIEAQASGKPIVTTRVGGIENIVMPGETALLADPASPAEFGNLLRTLAEDPEKRASFSRKGWPFVSSRFHYTRLVADMERLYYELLLQKS